MAGATPGTDWPNPPGAHGSDVAHSEDGQWEHWCPDEVSIGERVEWRAAKRCSGWAMLAAGGAMVRLVCVAMPGSPCRAQCAPGTAPLPAALPRVRTAIRTRTGNRRHGIDRRSSQIAINST